MNRIDRENSHAMRTGKPAAVIAMPARRPGVVVTMHPRASKVIAMPARGGSKTAGPEPNAPPHPAPLSRFAASCDALYCGMRMTLLALLAFLGWPKPTRGNDPGPAAARPGFWERVDLVSKLRLPGTVQPIAACAAAVELPLSCFEEAA